jgi:hypothetical protein
MKKSILIISLPVIAIIFLAVAQTVLSNVLSTSGVEVSKISSEIEFYKTENLLLKEKLYRQESLENVASRASELGFVKSKHQLIISPTRTVLTRILSEIK